MKCSPSLGWQCLEVVLVLSVLVAWLSEVKEKILPIFLLELIAEGGNSFFSARYGFVCDNVANFEVCSSNYIHVKQY